MDAEEEARFGVGGFEASAHEALCSAVLFDVGEEQLDAL